MLLSAEDRRRQYRLIYEVLWKDPRIHVKDLARVLNINPRAASRRLSEALSLGIFSPLQIRIRSFSNKLEYMYFVNSEDPLEMYMELSENPNVIYHAVMDGFSNLWIVTKEKIRIDGDIVLEGVRSDYHVAFAPDHSWEQSVAAMQKKVEGFNPKMYCPTRRIQSHWHESIPWGKDDEILYRAFKYNLRKKLTQVMEEHFLSTTKVYEWLNRLPECCTIFMRYFPSGVSTYDPYLFMFETDYEDFIVDLFSELPTSSFFFRVGDKLFLSARIEKSSVRNVDYEMSNISQLHIPLLIKALKKKEVLRREAHALFEYHWKKEL